MRILSYCFWFLLTSHCHSYCYRLLRKGGYGAFEAGLGEKTYSTEFSSRSLLFLSVLLQDDGIDDIALVVYDNDAWMMTRDNDDREQV